MSRIWASVRCLVKTECPGRQDCGPRRNEQTPFNNEQLGHEINSWHRDGGKSLHHRGKRILVDISEWVSIDYHDTESSWELEFKLHQCDRQVRKNITISTVKVKFLWVEASFGFSFLGRTKLLAQRMDERQKKKEMICDWFKFQIDSHWWVGHLKSIFRPKLKSCSRKRKEKKNCILYKVQNYYIDRGCVRICEDM